MRTRVATRSTAISGLWNVNSRRGSYSATVIGFRLLPRRLRQTNRAQDAGAVAQVGGRKVARDAVDA